MNRTIAILVIAALMAMVPAGLVSLAAAHTLSCSQDAYNVWEDSNFTGDGLHVCYPSNLPNLASMTHTQPGLCSATFKARDDWDDCLSSAKNLVGNESHRVCFYTGANYTGSRYVLPSNGQASWLWPDTFADSISSIRWDC